MIAAATPWYGVPLLAGVFTVVAVVLTFIGSRINEHYRGKREDARRWHDKVLELAAGFSIAANDFQTRTQAYFRDRDLPDPDVKELERIKTHLLFVGSPTINVTADRYFIALVNYSAQNIYSATDVLPSHLPMIASTSLAFTNAVRTYLHQPTLEKEFDFKV